MRAWAFDVSVAYRDEDKRGDVRIFFAHEQLIGIGSGQDLTEQEAYVLAKRQLSSAPFLRKYVSPDPAVGYGYLYEERLNDRHD